MTGAATSAAPRSAPTVGAARGRAQLRLASAGCESASLDAELLLAHALGVARAQLVMEPERVLAPGELAAFEALVARRERHEPVAYILGRKSFRHIELEVDSRVLVPRPETELLVEAALGLPHGARVVDVGTGSGAVALALKHERPDLDVAATDVSQEALIVARANAERLGLGPLPPPRSDAVLPCGRRVTSAQDGVSFFAGDLLDPLPGRIDAVVANLPYVADPEWSALPPDVADHEPRLALAGGPDGLDLVRRLVAQAATRARWLALEVGEGQAARVRALLDVTGMVTEVRADLGGMDRVVVGRRP